MTNHRWTILLVALPACVAARPDFAEPRWGNAPPPLALEVTEVTVDRRSCIATACLRETVLLRRDGAASRQFQSRAGRDSILIGRVDSATFVHVAQELLRGKFFAGTDDDGWHEPLTNESVVMSASTLCRRRVASLGPRALARGDYQQIRAVIDSVVRSMSWTRPGIH